REQRAQFAAPLLLRVPSARSRAATPAGARALAWPRRPPGLATHLPAGIAGTGTGEPGRPRSPSVRPRLRSGPLQRRPPPAAHAAGDRGLRGARDPAADTRTRGRSVAAHAVGPNRLLVD